jgi:hypothetical protein
VLPMIFYVDYVVCHGRATGRWNGMPVSRQ